MTKPTHDNPVRLLAVPAEHWPALLTWLHSQGFAADRAPEIDTDNPVYTISVLE